MPDRDGPSRRARGEIEVLPSGSLRVRVYAGVDAATGRRRYLTETVPAGPAAAAQAAQVRERLLAEVAEHRNRSAASLGGRWRRGAVGAGERGTVGGGRPARDADTGGAGAAGADVASARQSPALAAARRGRRRGEMTVAAIARLAGVSPPTVSKVLNGRSGVAVQTRRRVETLLREQGYRRPEMVAPVAAVEVVFYGMQSGLAIEIMQGVEQVVGDWKLAVGFTDVARQVSAGRSWAEALLARRPTGVITVHFGLGAEQHALLGASGIPVVALDPTGHPLHDVPSVGATNWSGGILATRHLLDLGHRRIAVVAGPGDRFCARARLEGARAALEAAGVGLDEQLVRMGEFSFGDGLECGRELLARPDPPTAVLCGDDLQALGVYEAARRRGMRIPQDLSVVGFDDIPNAQWCGPAMTTVRQPLRDMGAAAARMVLALAAGQVLAQTRVELATTLVVRESTAAPGRS